MQDFEQARQQFVLGIAAFEAGRFEEAEAAFRNSLAHLPGRPSTLTNLGATLIKRGQPEAALSPLAEALAAEPGNLDAWCHRGAALSSLGRDAEALQCYARAQALDATHAAAWFHAAQSHNLLGQLGEALGAFEHFLKLQPQHALAWAQQGETLQALQRHGDALASYERALALDPTLGDAWSHRGGLLRDAGQFDEAAESFRRALAHGADAELNHYFLAAVQQQAQAPQTAPARYVEFMFDGYAREFDQHLVQVLHYQAPRVLAEGLARLARGPFDAALDLGCGTGLCGPLLRPQVARLEGVDLSQGMLAQARALGVYDALVHADIAEHLRQTDARYGLVVAADVFIYVGALRAVFAGVARVLAPGGVFAFSVEEALGDEGGEAGFALRSSLRYAHHEDYLRALAAEHGLGVLQLARHTLREDQRQPVAGLYMYLVRS